jgi:hypothetical protein
MNDSAVRTIGIHDIQLERTTCNQTGIAYLTAAFGVEYGFLRYQFDEASGTMSGGTLQNPERTTPALAGQFIVPEEFRRFAIAKLDKSLLGAQR